MKTEPVITLRGVSNGHEIEEKVRRRALRLDRYCDDIQACHVWVDAPHGHHLQGRLYDVRIRIAVPDEEIAVDGQPQDDDVAVAIRNAFDAARRQIEDYVRRRRGEVKSRRPSAAATEAEEGGV
jgi:ribosome-associated translation inhibitor RaiA